MPIDLCCSRRWNARWSTDSRPLVRGEAAFDFAAVQRHTTTCSVNGGSVRRPATRDSGAGGVDHQAVGHRKLPGRFNRGRRCRQKRPTPRSHGTWHPGPAGPARPPGDPPGRRRCNDRSQAAHRFRGTNVAVDPARDLGNLPSLILAISGRRRHLLRVVTLLDGLPAPTSEATCHADSPTSPASRCSSVVPPQRRRKDTTGRPGASHRAACRAKPALAPPFHHCRSARPAQLDTFGGSTPPSQRG